MYLVLTKLQDPQVGATLIVVFAFGLLLALSLAAASINNTISLPASEGLNLNGTFSKHSFHVPKRNFKKAGFQYPACELGFDNFNLLDFAVLAESSYTGSNFTQGYV